MNREPLVLVIENQMFLNQVPAFTSTLQKTGLMEDLQGEADRTSIHMQTLVA